ncbi:hypothetical protein Q3G72_013893 [Acer saccharum]|nr:hypothetical protein Q3G72_013893 [Acer saccharum]
MFSKNIKIKRWWSSSEVDEGGGLARGSQLLQTFLETKYPYDDDEGVEPELQCALKDCLVGDTGYPNNDEEKAKKADERFEDLKGTRLVEKKAENHIHLHF